MVVKNESMYVKMKKVYIYPMFKKRTSTTGNTYAKLMCDAFNSSDQFRVVDHKIFGDSTFLNMYANLDADIFIFNWIENFRLSFKKITQFITFLGFLSVAILMRKDIVWMLHNKHPHKGRNKVSFHTMKIMSRVSTCVITHSLEGKKYFEEKLSKKDKCYYIPHPVYTDIIIPSRDIKWDYIIWGGISERKGILEFVKYASKSEYFLSKSILICGNCKNEKLADSIRQSLSDNIEFINRFLSDDEISSYISKSRYILFTYAPSSVLSSGGLVYSLNFLKPIIGPNVGSFAEAKGIVSCYNEFNDIEKLEISFDSDSCKDYIKNNAWEEFPLKLMAIINNKKNRRI